MLHAIARRSLLASGATLLAAPALVRAQGNPPGLALVIGNSKYQWESSLPNAKRDATDIAQRFQSLGLKTELVQDAGKEAMRKAINKIRSAPSGTDFAAFYFAGHGVSWEKNAYIVPADADLSTPSADALIPTGSVHGALRKATHRLAIYDSCRNNPADGWRQKQAEDNSVVRADQQRLNAEKDANRLTLFSTAPGRAALDGPAGQNSPFAAAFLRHFAGASIDLHQLPARLRRDLLLATQGRQLLYDFNYFDHPFQLKGAGASPAASNDPSRIVELPKAYAFARENGFDLPTGLIALKPAAASRDSQKVGTFKYSERNNSGINPLLLIVLSVGEDKTAQIILSGKSNRGPFWRFVTGKVSGDRLEYVPHGAGARTMFDWRDANSGSVGMIWEQERSTRPFNTDFTRLDG